MNSQQRPVALVTGASGGIGRAIAGALSRTHHLILGGRDESVLARVADELPSAEPWVADLSDPGAVSALAENITDLDALIHSAGSYTRGYVAELDRSQWVREFEVNLFAPAELTKLLLPALRKSHGTIVFINSGAGQFSFSRGALYGGTKFALKTLADTTRIEERANGLRVTSIFPGLVETDLIKTVVALEGGEYNPSGYLQPATVASAVALAVLAPPEASYESITVRPAGAVAAVPEPSFASK